MKPGEFLQAFSLIMGTFSLILGIVTLTRYQEQVAGQTGVAVDIPQVCYLDGEVLVDVREGNWYSLQDFVQPNDPTVRQVVRQIIS